MPKTPRLTLTDKPDYEGAVQEALTEQQRRFDLAQEERLGPTQSARNLPRGRSSQEVAPQEVAPISQKEWGQRAALGMVELDETPKLPQVDLDVDAPEEDEGSRGSGSTLLEQYHTRQLPGYEKPERGSNEEWAEVEEITKTLELDPPWYKKAAKYLTGGEAEEDVGRFFTEFPGRVAEGAEIVGTEFMNFANERFEQEAREEEASKERSRVLREEGIGSYIDQFVTAPTEEASQQLKRIATGGMTIDEAQMGLAGASLDPSPVSYLADLTSAGLYLYEGEPGYAALAASPIGLVGGAGAFSAYTAVKAVKLAKAARQAEAAGDLSKAEKLLAKASPMSIAGAKTADEAVEAAEMWRTMGTKSPYFQRWFGDSVMTHRKSGIGPAALGERGHLQPWPGDPGFDEPIKLYHGTKAGKEIEATGVLRPGTGGIETAGRGIYLTPNPRVAGEYAGSGSIMPLYANLRNPLVSNRLPPKKFTDGVADELEALAKTMDDVPKHRQELLVDAAKYRDRAYLAQRMKHHEGYEGFYSVMGDDLSKSYYYVRNNVVPKHFDGIILHRPKGHTTEIEVVVFNSNQVKSATGNVGTFSRADPRYSHGIGPMMGAGPAAAAIRSQTKESE